jgi:replicative DNA helicase
VASELEPTDFYSGRNQAVFKAIKDLGEEGLTVNPLSVAERSGATRTDVDELLASAQGIGPKELKTLLADVRRIGALRNIYIACTNAASQVSKDSRVEEVVDILEKGLYKAGRDGSDEASDGSEVLARVVEDFLQRHKLGG